MVVLGGGVVGTNAARIAIGMEAEVTILERSRDRMRSLDELFRRRARILMSDTSALEAALAEADVVIGAVLIAGARTPMLVMGEMLPLMRVGTVIVDVDVDQGGCFETSRPTTHKEPIYEVDGILHYCVANMPGAVAATATRALTNAVLPYVRALCNLGVDEALAADSGLAAGVNVRAGEITCRPVADAHGRGARTAVAIPR